MRSSPPDDLRQPQAVPPEVHAELHRVAPRLGAMARRVHWLGAAGSTNDVAAHLADLGAEEGTLVVAESQTQGRGRHGREWFSPAGAGLYVSVVLRPMSGLRLAPERDPATLLTLAGGVALAEAVRGVTGLPAELKWPNDVLIGKRKLAGILAEAAAHAGGRQFVVLGFGVNLQTAAYPAALASRATSIEAESGRSPDRALILAEILACIAERYADLRAGRFDAILSAWRRLAPSVPGARVEWDGPGGVIAGRVEGIDNQGALLVRVGERVERLIAGEVRWI